VAVVNGRAEKMHGTLRDDEEYAEVYVPSLGRTTRVYRDCRGAYISENITELVYTNSKLLVMNGDALCRGALATVQSVPRGFRFPRYKFVQGVPGCGKTYEIEGHLRRAKDEGKTVLYLTATVASKLKVCETVYGSSKEYAKRCCTYDSYLMHGSDPPNKGTWDVVYMDEAPMAHKGQLYACMLRAGASDVVFYGDREQLPWLSFMADFKALHWQLTDAEVMLEKRVVTHRFGRRICAMWLDVYGEIYPCDCHDHDDVVPEVVQITSASAVPALPTGKLLCFTQEERVTIRRELQFVGSVAELKSKDAGGLSTVAEDQGGTHDEVSLVRIVNKRNPKESSLSPSIYNRQPWVLVGTTRQRGRLKYYTTSGDDLVRARFRLATCPERLRAVDLKLHWRAVSARARNVTTFGI